MSTRPVAFTRKHGFQCQCQDIVNNNDIYLANPIPDTDTLTRMILSSMIVWIVCLPLRFLQSKDPPK